MENTDLKVGMIVYHIESGHELIIIEKLENDLWLCGNNKDTKIKDEKFNSSELSIDSNRIRWGSKPKTNNSY